MILKPLFNTRHVERVLTLDKLPDFIAVGEHHETDGALVSDLLGMCIFLDFPAGVRSYGGLGCDRRGDVDGDVRCIIGGSAAAAR